MSDDLNQAMADIKRTHDAAIAAMSWQIVLNQDRDRIGPYAEGFDPKQVYEFKRSDNESVIGKFSLADASPHFNVAGLWFREPPHDLRP